MLLYALLHLTGYDSVSIEDIKQFRQWGSKTPGHPETFETPGVEVTTGPGCRMLWAWPSLNPTWQRSSTRPTPPWWITTLRDHGRWLQSGGCVLRRSLAWKLGKLIALYDDNSITIDGRTDVLHGGCAEALRGLRLARQQWPKATRTWMPSPRRSKPRP